MSIVCDTGPLIALGGIDQLGLLQTLFDQVMVPEQVAKEVLVKGANGLGASAFQQASWLQITSVPMEAQTILTASLDIGEASVIVLALDQSVSLILMDENRGRKIARELYGLNVIGTGRVLVEAKAKGLIQNVKPLLANIRGNGYWISDFIMSAICQQVGE